MKKVAIIGGGLSGALCTINLLKESTENLHIILIEKEPSHWLRGVAYSSTLSHQNLNVPAKKMSLFSNKPQDFCQWLQTRGYSFADNDFVPRHIFGAYIAAAFSAAQMLNSNHILELYKNVEIAAISAAGNQFILTQANADIPIFSVDEVVLCTGNLPPKPLAAFAKTLVKSNLYVGKPWQGTHLARTPKDASIFIAGTGLTMADQVLSLVANNHQGPIYILSRNGKLPLAHCATAPYVLSSPPPKQNTTILKLLQWFRLEVAIAKKEGHPWQAVIDAFRPFAQIVWQSLEDAEKRTFFAHVRTFWEIHRHRLPAESLQKLTALQQSGQLQLLSGRISKAAICENRIEINYADKNSKIEKHVVADLLINCTGPQQTSKNNESGLLGSLLDKGFAQTDSFGLGIQTNELNNMIDAENCANPRIHCIGPVAKASLWETTALHEIRTQAEALPQKINQKKYSVLTQKQRLV